MPAHDLDIESGERLLRAIVDIIPATRDAIDHVLFGADDDERAGACREVMRAAREALEISGHFKGEPDSGRA